MKNNLIPAALVVGGLSAFGLVGSSEAEPISRCTAPETVTFMQDQPFESVAAEIRDTRFFANDAEYTYQHQQDYKKFFASKGIEVIEHLDRQFRPTRESLQANNWLFDLATVPDSIIRASGLKRIVVLNDDVKGAQAQSDPYITRHYEGTLWADDRYELQAGIAAMVLENYCDKAAVMQKFRDITEKAGFAYDPEFTYNFGTGSEFDRQWKEFQATYGEVFATSSHVRSPEQEFVSLFNDFMNGWSWSQPDNSTAIGKKQALVQNIFNKIEPHGEALQQLMNYGAGVGTHGLHPQALVGRVACMIDTLASADNEVERRHIIDVDADEEAPDPNLPNCDARPYYKNLMINAMITSRTTRSADLPPFDL